MILNFQYNGGGIYIEHSHIECVKSVKLGNGVHKFRTEIHMTSGEIHYPVNSIAEVLEVWTQAKTYD